MCLIINKKACPNGYKIAKKNIPCYKILMKISSKYKTPYREATVNVKIGLEANYFQEKPHNCVVADYALRTIYTELRIEHGIHSYINLKAAKKETKRIILSWVASSNIKILKAYIPKGTKYWVGENHEFCSERIVFAKK